MFANLDYLNHNWHIHMLLNFLKVAKLVHADNTIFVGYSILNCISSTWKFSRHIHACLTFNSKDKWGKFENNLIDNFFGSILLATNKHTSNIQQWL